MSEHKPCCDACGGTGAASEQGTSGRCWDCYGTGCAHPPLDHIDRVAETVGSCDGGDCSRRAVAMAYCERIDSLIPVCRRHLCAYKVLHGTRWQAEDEWVGLRFARRSRWKFLAQWKLLLDQRLTLAGFDPQRRRRNRADATT